ncbi:MAG TPA: VOC family protein [Anaerolineales bacterium]|nr:VOC family protein [Anaerolineales bacterium]
MLHYSEKTALNIGAIDHISINVSDIEKSIDFYGRILGFKQLNSVDCGDFIIHYFQLPNGSRLELFDYHGNAKKPPREDSDIGLRHLAFQVEDVAAHERLLREAGAVITLPTCDLPNLGARVLLFLDPNGITIEFCERL